ncbi:phage tail protein [Rhizobium sp. RU36D]|uniref:phage tail protein n=1 Tax=Rhizobium sp. RU36D TaxID=1907415 RepID=UPI0009D88540|nr:phage tail protein [Rhizobium sp. RU36D]SMD18094.1 Phage Tail Collar Domain [Rhizobium sp. RU36D]
MLTYTLRYGWAKPDPEANVDDEFFRLQTTLDQIDDDMFGLAGAIAGKANAAHAHAIADITGLSAALAAKQDAGAAFSLDSLSDVQGAAGAAVNYVLVKSTTGTWEPSSAIAALGPHQHAQADIVGLSASLREVAPPGAVSAFAMSSAPVGWIKANGAAVSRSTYSALFAAIGTTFGVGDGSTTFNLPDLRGEFVRGWDDARGIDASRGFGSAQGSQNLTHSHGVNDPGHSHPYTRAWNGGLYAGGPFPARDSDNTLNTGHVGTGISIQASGGSEARPRNIALLYCIKY